MPIPKVPLGTRLEMPVPEGTLGTRTVGGIKFAYFYRRNSMYFCVSTTNPRFLDLADLNTCAL